MDTSTLNFPQRWYGQSSLTNSSAGSLHAAIKPRIFTGELLQRTWIPQCFASYSPGELHHQTTRWHHMDITAAFLNAELPPGRVVVFRPPSILYRLGLIPQGFCWRVHRAIYGLREAPSLWQDERTSEMTKAKLKVQGEPVKVIVSQVHQSLRMIVKERDLIDSPDILQYGITKRVEPKRILAMVGIYVDDYLTVGQPETVEKFLSFEKFLSYLRRLWNTSDPQYLSQSSELPFLGLTIQRSPSGLFLHQVQYAELLLEEHASHIPKRARTTTGEAESFKEEQNPSQPPDQGNPDPEHLRMDQDRTKNHSSSTLAFYPYADQICHARCHWHHKLSSRISRSSRIDLGIYSSTLSQRKTWVFPLHFRKGPPTSSASPSSQSTPTLLLHQRVNNRRLG